MSRHAPRPAALALLALFLPLLVLAAPPALENVVPAEADIVILIEDLPGLREDLPNLPIMHAWEDPAIQAAIRHFSGMEEVPQLPAWFLAEPDAAAEVDDPHAQFVNSLTGQVAIMLDLDALVGADTDSEEHKLPAGFGLLAHVEGNEETVAALLEPGGDDEAEAASPMALPAGTWKIARGVVAISGAAEGAEALAAALTGAGPAAPLSAGSGFQVMRRHEGKSDMDLLVNLEPVVGLLREALTAEDGGMPENELGITAENLLSGLGLDVLRSLWLSVNLYPDATETTGGITFTEERGVIRLAAVKPLPAGPRLPLPAHALDASTYVYDVAAAWAAVQEIAADVSPMLGAVLEAQVAQMSAQFGIDLGKEIPGAFDGLFASATFLHPLPAGEELAAPEDFSKMMSQVWVAKLTPENRLEDALAALTPMLGAMGMTASTRTVDEQVINILAPPAAEGTAITEDEQFMAGMGWVVKGDYLVGGQGRVGDLVEVLAGVAGDDPGIWGKKMVRQTLGTLPDGAFAVEYQDSGRLMQGMVSSALAALPTDEGGGMAPQEIEDLAQALSRFMTITVSSGYKSAGELVVKSRTLHGTP